VGGITETDATLAAASNAILLGFNVRADAYARRVIDEESLDLRYYSVIYNLIDEVKAAMSGMMAPEYKQQDNRKHLAYEMTCRAKAGEDFAQYMGALADRVHGTELKVVVKPQPAERIQAGDKRTNSKGTVMTAVRQEGQRLHFKYERADGKVLISWMSPRSWRTLQVA
jgi:hypothetical protein